MDEDTKASQLSVAIGSSDIAKIHELLAEGVRLDSPGRLGFTPLTDALIKSRALDPVVWAVPNPDPEPLRILLAAGARYGLRDAVFLGDAELARDLIASGADVNGGSVLVFRPTADDGCRDGPARNRPVAAR